MNRYLMPLAVVAVSLGVYFFYIDAAYVGITQKLASEKVIESFLLDAQNARAKLDSVVAEYRAFPLGTDARLQVLLPDEVDPVRLVVDVNAVAEKHGLILKTPLVTLGVINPESPAEYVSHTIRFNVVSTYPVFREFLLDIQSSLALRDFDKIAFSAPSETPDKAGQIISDPRFTVFDYSVELTTYSLR